MQIHHWGRVIFQKAAGADSPFNMWKLIYCVSEPPLYAHICKYLQLLFSLAIIVSKVLQEATASQGFTEWFSRFGVEFK